AEHSLEGLDQTAVLRSALLHAKSVQHLSAAVERDGVALLAKRPKWRGREARGGPAPRAVRSWDGRSPARGNDRFDARATGRQGCGASPASRRARKGVRRTQ